MYITVSLEIKKGPNQKKTREITCSTDVNVEQYTPTRDIPSHDTTATRVK